MKVTELRQIIKEEISKVLGEAKADITEDMVIILDKGPTLILYNIKDDKILGTINVYNNEVTGVAAEKGFGPIMYELGMAMVYPKALQSDRRGNTTKSAEHIWNKFISGIDPKIKVEKVKSSDKDYMSVWPETGEVIDPYYLDGFINYKFYNPDKSVLDKLIKRGDAILKDKQEDIVKRANDFYQRRVNYPYN
jgi:hypothetical protein